MDQDTLREIEAAIGSTLYTVGPLPLDLSTVNRMHEAFLLPAAADGDEVHPAWLAQLLRTWCDLSTDDRPAPPLGVNLGKGVNGGARMVATRPCRVSDMVRVVGTLDSVEVKQGRSGTLVLVTVLRTVSDVDGECARFYRTTVYRPDGRS